MRAPRYERRAANVRRERRHAGVALRAPLCDRRAANVRRVKLMVATVKPQGLGVRIAKRCVFHSETS